MSHRKSRLCQLLPIPAVESQSEITFTSRSLPVRRLRHGSATAGANPELIKGQRVGGYKSWVKLQSVKKKNTHPHTVFNPIG